MTTRIKTRTVLTLAAAAMTGLLVATSTHAITVANHSFEDDGAVGGASIPSGWSRDGNGSGVRTNVKGITPTDGSIQAWVNINSTLYQDTGETIVDGTEYNLSIDFNPDQVNFPNQETVFVRLYGSTSGFGVAFAEVSELGPAGAAGSDAENGAQWDTATVSFTATGAEAGQTLGVAFGVTAGIQSEWDNVRLTTGGGPMGLDGDYNDNGQVEQGDLDLVLLNWGDAIPGDGVPAGWTNPDFQPTPDAIDQDDLDGVLLNWGNTATSSAAAVPEPASLALLGLAGLAMLVRRRRG